MTEIIGILNLTRDSFSDGGAYLDCDAAVAHAMRMADDGAKIIDVGAESSHPDSEDVPADEELRRLTPVVERLAATGVCVSVDTYKPKVMHQVLKLGVEIINDISGFRDPAAVDAVRESDARLIVMHSRSVKPRATRARLSQDPPAKRAAASEPEKGAAAAERVPSIVREVLAFARQRTEALGSAGIAVERLILDPGMGFFLSAEPGPSFSVLRHIRGLRATGMPVCISTSRKSFIGAELDRTVDERGAGTLASEIWAWQQGVEYIRTHDVRALCDAVRVLSAIRAAE